MDGPGTLGPAAPALCESGPVLERITRRLTTRHIRAFSRETASRYAGSARCCSAAGPGGVRRSGWLPTAGTAPVRLPVRPYAGGPLGRGAAGPRAVPAPPPVVPAAAEPPGTPASAAGCEMWALRSSAQP